MARIDLQGIKDNMRQILLDANTITGDPINLSDGLIAPVKQILQVNPERIRDQMQPSFFPCITMFYDGKEIELQDIGATALRGRRRAEIDLKIVGFVWIDNMNTSGFELKDLADNECEKLMENIEHITRNDSTIGNKVTWSKATNVTYHSFPVSEGAHMRAGILNLRLSIIY